MSRAGRLSTQPIRPFVRLPEQSAAPIAAASSTDAAIVYMNGTSLVVSLDGAAYAAIALATGGTFTGLVTIDTSAAPAFSIDSDAVSGTIARIRHDVSTTPTGALVGFSVDLATSWVAGNVAHTGVSIAIPATTAAAAAGEGALVIGSDATVARVIDVDVANASGTIAIVRWGAATTLSGAATTILSLDGTTSTTPGSVGFTGLSIAVPADTAAAANGRGAIAINSDATLARVLDVDVANQSGTIAMIRYGAAVTLTSTALVGLSIDMTTNVTAATNDPPVTGVLIAIPATDIQGAAGQGALAINSDATAARVMDIDVANTASTIAILRYGAATTLTDALIGIDLNLSANVTPGANAITAFRITTAATTRAETAGEGVIVIDSNGTAMRVLDVAVANTSGTLFNVRWDSAATLAGATTLLNLDGNTNVTGGSQAFSGVIVATPAAITSASYCATFDFRGTAGTAAGNGIVNVQVGAATTLTAQLVGVECDLSTNVTPGANAVIGTRILIPATTRANTAAEGALVISSDATAARAVDIDVANVSGTISIIRYGASTTPTGAVTGFSVDLSTNVVSNAQANIGVDITMLLADRMTSAPLRMNGVRVFVSAGIPIAENGSNGDIHIDSDGAKASFRPTMYQRQSAAWVAIA